MARMIPASCSTKSPGERDVFEALRKDPGTTSWTVLHSLDLAKHVSQVAGEIDFVVLVPHLGVLCLEVKGASSVQVQDGQWYYGKDSHGHISPFKQAANAMYSLQNVIFQKLPHLKSVVFWSAVIFPYVPFTQHSPEWHDWIAIDNSRFGHIPISQLVTAILQKAREHLTKSAPGKWADSKGESPTPSECETITQVLRPQFESFQSPLRRQQQLESQVSYYTEQQLVALDAMDTNKQVIFNGLAGTGKTVLAIESARRATITQQHVLFVCFNHSLAEWLREQLSPHKDRVHVSTFHQYMLDLTGIAVPPNPKASFWADALPDMALNVLLESPGLYDQVIIDEAQDLLNPKFIDVIDQSLHQGLSGGIWRLFGDFDNQTIYNHDGNIALEDFRTHWAPWAATYKLTVNCRNTPRTTALLNDLPGLKSRYTRTLRPDDGNAPKFVSYAPGHESDLLIELIGQLHQESYNYEHIVILSPRTDSVSYKTAHMPHGPSYLKPFDRRAKGSVHYSTIHAFKGLESPVVIITDMAELRNTETTELFYTAISRSLEKVVVMAPAGHALSPESQPQ